MITEPVASRFAQEWMAAWNSHDIEKILDHYANEVEFASPFIRLLQFNDTGVITRKPDLRKYFQKALDSYPDLHFRFHNYFLGLNTLVIYYSSVSNRLAAEAFELDAHGKAAKVFCHYTTAPSLY